MKKTDILICVLSGVGFILSLVALVLRVHNDGSFLPEFTIAALSTEPLIWAVISGVTFLPKVALLLGKRRR